MSKPRSGPPEPLPSWRPSSAILGHFGGSWAVRGVEGRERPFLAVFRATAAESPVCAVNA